MVGRLIKVPLHSVPADLQGSEDSAARQSCVPGAAGTQQSSPCCKHMAGIPSWLALLCMAPGNAARAELHMQQ